MSKIGLLKGDKIHLSVIPKLGSSAIRNLYSKDIKHSETTHKEIDISKLDDTIIVFCKPQHEIFVSAIQTDFRASVLQDGNPPNFPIYRNNIYRLPKRQRELWMYLLETHTPYELEGSDWDRKNGDIDGFFNFATHIIETAFNLNHDISWMVTGHFSDSFNRLPELINRDNVLITDISSLSNPNFISWLRKKDKGWKHLDAKVICSTPKKFNYYDDSNSWNVSPPKYGSIMNSWIQYIIDLRKKPKTHFFDFGSVYASHSNSTKFNTRNKESNVVSANDTLLHTLSQQFKLSDTLYKCIIDSPKYLKFI